MQPVSQFTPGLRQCMPKSSFPGTSVNTEPNREVTLIWTPKKGGRSKQTRTQQPGISGTKPCKQVHIIPVVQAQDLSAPMRSCRSFDFSAHAYGCSRDPASDQ